MAEEQDKTSGARSGRPPCGRPRLRVEEKIRRGTFRPGRDREHPEISDAWAAQRAAEERAAAEVAAAAQPESSFFCWHCRRRKARWHGACCYPSAALQAKKRCAECGRGCAGKVCGICRTLIKEARPLVEAQCRQCRRSFSYVPSRTLPPKKMCGRACTRAFVAELQVNRRKDPTQKAEARRFRERLQGSKRRASGWRPVKGRWRLICERDGWRCWLCGQAIDPSLSNPHPLSGSVDHVVPLSKPGGSDADENCRAAHLRCNCRRGNGSRVQNAKRNRQPG